ncbi:MAG: hypothetical protein ACM3NH_04990 [Candidatus Saccharibacteria bacterium]
MEGMKFKLQPNHRYTWEQVENVISQCANPWQMSGVLHNLALQIGEMLAVTPDADRVCRAYTTAEMFLSAAKSAYPELKKTALTMLFSRILPHVPVHPSLIPFHLEVLNLLKERQPELCAGSLPDKVHSYLRKVESVLWNHCEPGHPGCCSHWSARHDFDCRESARFLSPHRSLVIWGFLEFGFAPYIDSGHDKQVVKDVIRKYLAERRFQESSAFSYLASGNVNKRLDDPDAQQCVNAKAFLKLLEIEYWENRLAEDSNR